MVQKILLRREEIDKNTTNLFKIIFEMNDIEYSPINEKRLVRWILDGDIIEKFDRDKFIEALVKELKDTDMLGEYNLIWKTK